MEREACLNRGKLTFMKAVHSSIPIYILSILSPPKKVIELLYHVFVEFLQGDFEGCTEKK